MTARPGFVLEVDRSTPPTMFWHGEGFRLEKLPAGSRVIYPKEPVDALRDPDGAVRHALLNPVGDSKPLPELLTPGMKLTICFDDVVLIAALALHRRMTEPELRHALGDRVYDAFMPSGRLQQHDAEDPDNLIFLGTTETGEEIEINKRAATSDLLVYVNINLVAMDGGWKSTATGLASYRSIRHHHNAKTMQKSKSFMDRHKSELHSSNWRMGKVLVDAGVKIFQIETTINNDTFPPEFQFLSKREWEWGLKDRASFLAVSKSLEMAPDSLKQKIFHNIQSPHAMTSVQAGEVEAVHELITATTLEQHLVTVEGQTDVLTMGIPFICPYNVNSVMNPILVACTGLGYFFNLYRGKPLVREGGVVIMSHPTKWAFDPRFHPSYIDFFEEVLADTTDPTEIHKYEERYATDPWYRHLYRTGNAYHGVHPFYMWYWCAHAIQHLGKIIIVGGDVAATKRMGFSPASTLRDALEMAEDVVGRNPSVTHIHNPPILMADVQ